MVILILFEGISGLHIKGRKSFVYLINEVTNMYCLEAMLSEKLVICQQLTWACLWVENPTLLIYGMVCWRSVKRNWLDGKLYLSFGGKLTLINLVSDALRTYMMTLFPIPAGVIKRLDTIKRMFLWHDNKRGKASIG